MDDPTAWCAPTPPAPPGPDCRRRVAPICPSTLCSMGWRPIMITGLIRDWLVRHFSEPDMIEEPDLKHLVWREDERTGILIESIHRWRGELVEKRPAIIVKQNGRRNERMGIRDMLGPDAQGNVTYQTFWVGSHTLFCIHGSGASADILATEVQREMTEFAPLIVEYLGLRQWQVAEVGEVAEVEEAREGFAVPVNVGWAYHEGWKLSREALKLRKVPLSVLLDGALVH